MSSSDQVSFEVEDFADEAALLVSVVDHDHADAHVDSFDLESKVRN
jgi:hypothetical protein